MSGNGFFHDESDISERIVWNIQNNKSQCSIAKVVTINASPVSVSIQPLVNYFDIVSQWQPYPVIDNVPVAQLQTISYSINTPLNIGDIGLVIWFDREIYTCLMNGATTPTTPTSGDLSDTGACVFIPIMQSFALAKPIQNTGVDFISAQVSLMTQLLTLMTQITSFFTDMQTFLTEVAAAPTTDLSSYAGAVASACSAFNLLITPIQAQITQITTALTTFKGMQP